MVSQKSLETRGAASLEETFLDRLAEIRHSRTTNAKSSTRGGAREKVQGNSKYIGMNKIQELAYLVATALVEGPGEAAVYVAKNGG